MIGDGEEVVDAYCCRVRCGGDEGCGAVGSREGAEAEWEQAGNERLEERSREDEEEEVECKFRRGGSCMGEISLAPTYSYRRRCAHGIGFLFQESRSMVDFALGLYGADVMSLVLRE